MGWALRYLIVLLMAPALFGGNLLGGENPSKSDLGDSVSRIPVTLTAIIDWSSPGEHPGLAGAHLEVIRNGVVVEKNDAGLPIHVRRTDTLPPGKHYYRLRVQFALYQELLSNPVFVEVR